MRVSESVVLALTSGSVASAFAFPDVSNLKSSVSNLFARKNGGSGSSGSGSGCPSIWTKISQDLTTSFVSNGQCTDLARAAIRYAFHDAGTFSLKLPFSAPAAGGADGSIFWANEIGRSENGGLGPYNDFMGTLWKKYGPQVTVADLIYFAGNHAVVSCPGGPRVKTLVGRKDSKSPSPTGVMPPGFGPGSDHDSLLQLFLDKGFSAEDLAALIGAHTTSRNESPQKAIPSGAPQDSTPGIWDVRYYSETYNPPSNIARFDSDINLSNKNTAVGKEFAGFVNNQGKWTGKFADAFFRMSVLGIPQADVDKFVDCTNVLPPSKSIKRDIRSPGRSLLDRVA